MSSSLNNGLLQSIIHVTYLLVSQAGSFVVYGWLVLLHARLLVKVIPCRIFQGIEKEGGRGLQEQNSDDLI